MTHFRETYAGPCPRIFSMDILRARGKRTGRERGESAGWRTFATLRAIYCRTVVTTTALGSRPDIAEVFAMSVPSVGFA